MIREQQVVLFRFPQTNQATGKLRPALVIRKIPGPHDDFLICMISSQLSQEVADFDEIISEKADDFISSGLKQASLIRIARLAVVEKTILLGAIGEVSAARLKRIKTRLSEWLIGR
jgi:mRNA interferase MazF